MAAGGIALLDPLQANGRRDWVGGYVGLDIAIDEAHQVRGFGAEFVLVHFMLEGVPLRTGLRGVSAAPGPIWRRRASRFSVALRCSGAGRSSVKLASRPPFS